MHVTGQALTVNATRILHLAESEAEMSCKTFVEKLVSLLILDVIDPD